MLAIVFGASEWPYYPDFVPAPSFRQSAARIADYLRSRDGLNLSRRNVKVLIDSFDDNTDILRQMHEFLRQRCEELTQIGTPATDLVIYYVGHGSFSEGDQFFLSVRSTNCDDPLGSSISANSLARLIRERAAGLRTYLVLDCCFAAAFMKTFMSGGPLTVASKQLRDALPHGDLLNRLPEYGVGLLCAAGSSEPAKAPAELQYTMFTGGVLELLRDGDPDAPEWLSLDFIQRLVHGKLRAQFANEAVMPQVHAPLQQVGRVDHVPLFPNPARRKRAVEYNAGLQPTSPLAEAATATVAPPLLSKKTPPQGSESAVTLGHKLDRAGRHSEAALHYQMAADQGTALAQVRLGILYETGRGVPQSYTEAARLYTLAAEQGNPAAQNNLGRLRETGSGLLQSFAEAAKLYQLAAAQGHADARSNLAYLYLTGRGVQQSDTEAVRLYHQAASQGHTSAQTSLGFLHEHGRGLPKSYEEAARFYRIAAEGGDMSACYHMGRLYETGRGVRRSTADAMMWYRRAARQSHPEAEAALRRLESLE
jgi:hypothetical protein